MRSATPAPLSSHKKQQDLVEKWPDHPFLTRKGIELIKQYTTPRTYIGMGRYASYKEYGESSWRIGYGSLKIKKRVVSSTDKLGSEEIGNLLVEDLKPFSLLVNAYVLIPLNEHRKSAVLSFAHSIGIPSFKECRLLELINSGATKQAIIQEWSPYINTIWRSGGERMINRRRAELDTFLTADKQIPTALPHRCHSKHCLMNIPELYTGTMPQIKAIEYLEKRFMEFDPSGEILRRFFRMWNEKPRGLSSPPPPKSSF